MAEQRVDHDIADELDAALVDAFLEQIGLSVGLGGEEQIGQLVGQHAVNFLRHAAVAAAQPGLNMDHGHAALARYQSASERGVNVANDKHDMWPELAQGSFET